MQDFSRVFNFGKNSYLYTKKYSCNDEIVTKTISKQENNVISPVVEKIKYGNEAYSYQYFNNREMFFADNLLRRSTFRVTKQLNGNQYNEIKVGKIKKGQIIPATNDAHDLALLKKFKAMIKKF